MVTEKVEVKDMKVVEKVEDDKLKVKVVILVEKVEEKEEVDS